MVETEPSTFSCGKPIPRLPAKRRLQIPPARMATGARIGPRSVTTESSRPAAVSTPRTAQPVRIVAPSARAASAMAGAARSGSAQPSLAVYSAPPTATGQPGTSASSSARDTMRLSSPAPCTLSSQAACSPSVEG